MNIEQWLNSLGMEQYIPIFLENEVSMEDLSDLDSSDLKDELGITKLKHRKTILHAIQSIELSSTEPEEPTCYPEGLLPNDLPTYLAHPWKELHQESHPRLKLHWLVDTAELIVRWTVALAFAERLSVEDPKLPVKATNILREHIERPTLGRWLLILRTIVHMPTVVDLLQGDLKNFATDHVDPAFSTVASGGNIQDSLLILRNHVAHGGGMATSTAEKLFAHHYTRLCSLLLKVKVLTQSMMILQVSEDEAVNLIGLNPRSIGIPQELPTGTWLLNNDVAGFLMPIARYEPVQQVTVGGELLEVSPQRIPMLYSRSGDGRLSYTPLGGTYAVSERYVTDHFRSMFRLDEPLVSQQSMTAGEYHWDGFLREARLISEDLVGRQEELSTVKRWLKSRKISGDENVIGWISGGPGSGKSLLMARLASDYGNSSHRGFYYHRFRGGDGRNSIRVFLELLQMALWSWKPLQEFTNAPDKDLEVEQLIEDITRRFAGLAQIPKVHPSAPPASFWVFLDGMDEIVSHSPTVMTLCEQLAGQHRLLLLAGRPDHGLQEFWSSERAHCLFPSGLPPMKKDDIRAMLVEGLGPARYTLLRRDKETNSGVENQFVDSVTERAHGLPLYVHLLLEDLRAGLLSVNDEKRLPDGLTAYYDDLMDRLGMSTVKRDLPLVVCLLARAEEPLTIESIAQLLDRLSTRWRRYIPRVEQALRAGRALVRQAPTSDGVIGWSLYHQSFREYVGGIEDEDGNQLTPPAKALAGVVEEADDLLIEACLQWKSLEEPSSLRSYVLRHAVKDLLDGNLQDEAIRLLSDIEFILCSKQIQDSYIPMFRMWEKVGVTYPQRYYIKTLRQTAQESENRDDLVRVLNFMEICVQFKWYDGMYDIPEMIAPKMLQLFGPSDPQTVHAYNKLGYLRFLNGDHRRSLEALEFNYHMVKKHIAVNDWQFVLVLNNLVLTHHALGNYSTVVDIANEWIAIMVEQHKDKVPAHARYLRARAIYELGDIEKAIEELQECIVMRSHSDHIHYTIGYMRTLSVWTEKLGEAEKALDIAINGFEYGRKLMGLKYYETQAVFNRVLELSTTLERLDLIETYQQKYGWAISSSVS